MWNTLKWAEIGGECFPRFNFFHGVKGCFNNKQNGQKDKSNSCEEPPHWKKVCSVSFGFSVQFSSVAQSCLTLFDPMNCSMPGLPVHHQLLESTQTHVIGSVISSNHLILCHPFLLLPSIFPSIRVFSNESALCIRWPKYWSFNFITSPSNEHLGLNSFRMDWLDLLAV